MTARARNCGCFAHDGFVLGSEYQGPAQQLSLEGLTPLGDCDIVDIPGSVSALVEPSEPIFVDELLDQQHRRFHNDFS